MSPTKENQKENNQLNLSKYRGGIALMVNRKDSPLANLPSLLASFHIALDKHVGLSTASSWKQNAHKRDGDDANVHVTVVNHVECKKMPTLRNNSWRQPK